MRIFCDTNIITEFLEKRLQFGAVSKILLSGVDSHELYLSEGGFYTITFLVDKQLRRMGIANPERLENERKILLRILDSFHVVSVAKSGLVQGVMDEGFRDLEDSYQYRAALSCKADVLLTINIKDFLSLSESAPIRVMSPQSFVDEYMMQMLGNDNEQ